MKYTATLLAGCLVAALIYFGLALALAPAPIASEYWVRELIICKRQLARDTEGHPRLIVAAGSNVLFGVDTVQMTRELGLPVLNLGLHGSLPLDAILQEAESAARTGDTLVLPLEFSFYSQEAINPWQVRSAIAWNHEQWHKWSPWEKVMAIRSCDCLLVPEILWARLLGMMDPGRLKDRVETLDDARILRAFAERKPASSFAYSAYNLDELGNLRATNLSRYFGTPRPADQEWAFAEASLLRLESFVLRLRARNIPVYFAHPPSLRTDRIDYSKLENSDHRAVQRLQQIAPVLDKASELLFERSEFLDTDLHLNEVGRGRRTDLLIHAIQAAGCVKVGRP